MSGMNDSEGQSPDSEGQSPDSEGQSPDKPLLTFHLSLTTSDWDALAF